MIEVEKKYYTSKKVYEFIYHKADFVSEKVVDDTYFDTKEYTLSLANTYLRNRNGGWELKAPTSEFDPLFPTFDEIAEDQLIIKYLGLTLESLSYDALAEIGYLPIVEYRSMRKKFKYGEFIIDLDETDFDLEYIEIELMVDFKEESDDAKKKIIECAQTIDPDIKPCLNSKFRYFLLNNIPDLEKKMEERGIFPPIEL